MATLGQKIIITYSLLCRKCGHRDEDCETKKPVKYFKSLGWGLIGDHTYCPDCKSKITKP